MPQLPNSVIDLLAKIQHLCEPPSPPTPSGDIMIRPKKNYTNDQFLYLTNLVVKFGGRWDVRGGYFLIPPKTTTQKIRVRLADLLVGPQPRVKSSQEDLEDLKASLRDRGQLEEIKVRQSKDLPGKYEVADGHRRWRAAEQIGWVELDAKIVDLDDLAMNENAFIVNVQRKALDDYECGRWYNRLLFMFPDTYKSQMDIVRRLGIKKGEVSRTILYYEQMRVQYGDVPPENMPDERTSRELRKIEDPALQKQITDVVRHEKLSSSQAETLINTITAGTATKIEDALKIVQDASEDKAKSNELKRKVLAKKASEYFPKQMVEDVTTRCGKMSEDKLFNLLLVATDISWDATKKMSAFTPKIIDKLDQIGCFKDNDLAKDTFSEWLMDLFGEDILNQVAKWKT